MKLPHTEVKFYPEVKSQTGLSSLRVSCKRGLIFSDFSNFIFEVPVEKVVIDEEELHRIDGMLNLENLPEQCSSIKNVGI